MICATFLVIFLGYIICFFGIRNQSLSQKISELEAKNTKLEAEYKALHDEHEYLLNDIAEMGNPKDA